MPLYQINENHLEQIPATKFAEEGVLERRHLQRLLKADISPLGDDLMVIAEEFSDWEESSRRIDLLCIDKEARLVVIEIKRTEDGGHMELQAIRYAAMVSSMTLDQAVIAYAKNFADVEDESRARGDILDFLEQDNPDEAELSGDIRIILVASDFSQELTTSVLWLNKRDLDITCIRFRPYRVGDKLLVETSQIIPLPETTDYETKLRHKEDRTQRAQTARHEILRRFWSQLIGRSLARTQLLANRSAGSVNWLSAGIGRAGFKLVLSMTEDQTRVECYIRQGRGSDDRNLAAFNALKQQRNAIEGVFAGPLDWQELPERIGCRICAHLEGGWRNPESDWPAFQDRMIETMTRLERALREPIRQLQV